MFVKMAVIYSILCLIHSHSQEVMSQICAYLHENISYFKTFEFYQWDYMHFCLLMRNEILLHVNNKSKDQPEHLHSLINVYVAYSMESIYTHSMEII